MHTNLALLIITIVFIQLSAADQPVSKCGGQLLEFDDPFLALHIDCNENTIKNKSFDQVIRDSNLIENDAQIRYKGKFKQMAQNLNVITFTFTSGICRLTKIR